MSAHAVTVPPACRRCKGAGEYKLVQWHHCGACYGTGIAGMTMWELEEQAILRRDLVPA